MFWGIIVKPGKTAAFVPPPDGSRLHLSQACVAGTPKSGERVSLLLKSGDEDEEGQFKVAGFLGLVSETVGLDLVLESYAEFSVEGKHPIHLTGYLMPDYEDGEGDDGMMYPGMEDDDSEDDEDDEDSDDDDGAGLTPKEKKALQKMINGGSVTIEELNGDGNADEEEDDDEDDDEEGDEEMDGDEDEEGDDDEDDDEDDDDEDEEEEDDEEEEEAAPPPQKKAKAETPKAEKADSSKAKPEPASAAKANKVQKFENGFMIEYLGMGPASGPIAKQGKRCTMKYIGRLKSNKKVFDQTKGNSTFSFRLGVGEVIKGWDKGVLGMRVGDKRKLTVPPQMAYGPSGIKGTIPPNATLEFDIQLVNVK